MKIVRSKPHTFAEMEAALVQARVGDTVSVVLTLGHKPTRYHVIDEDGDTLYLQGRNGAEPVLVIAAAEQTVWLSWSGKRNRRVVQVTVQAKPKREPLPRMEPFPLVEIDDSWRTPEAKRIQEKMADDARPISDPSRVALGQLYNVAHGHGPGTAPLPNEISPSTVVIDVMAAMLWHSRTPERTPIRVPPLDTYRSAISTSLPSRMQNEKSA